MNILFLTLVNFQDINKRGLTQDLMRELVKSGHHVYVVAPNERKYPKEIECTTQSNFTLIKFRSLNIVKTNIVEKGISTCIIPYLFEKAIKKYCSEVDFDIILYQTPPVTIAKTVSKLKKRFNAKTYLMLKDIFPQNACDLGMFDKKSLLYKYFRKQEIKLYNSADYIGCMSNANIKYLIENNPYLQEKVKNNQIELCPNSISIAQTIEIEEARKQQIIEKYLVDREKIVFMYGGNVGKPQDAKFIAECIKNCDNEMFQFIICGSGAEYSILENALLKEMQSGRVVLTGYLEKEEYDSLLKVCDVGLVFLNHNFTIPNFPSRILPYMENFMPIVAATDKVTDIKDMIVENNMGYWCESANSAEFSKLLSNYIIKKDNTVMKNVELINKQGTSANQYLKKHFSVAEAAKKIIAKVK